MQRSFDVSFSEHSYGFRPGRSAKQAVVRAQEIVASGRSYVVDLDMEKFFDRVNHDRIMAHLAKRIDDKRVLRLIRAFLNAGVMENGLLEASYGSSKSHSRNKADRRATKNSRGFLA